jgi:hypothetical protein
MHRAEVGRLGNNDLLARVLANQMQSEGIDAVGLCENPLPRSLGNESSGDAAVALPQSVLRVVFEALPVPDEQCSWQDILDFKAELHDKQWGFRRWLHVLATKQQTEAEIRDELEWMVNEYTKAMEVHHMKASQGFVEAYVVPVLELVEDVVRFRWSKIAKGALSVKKRKVELLEAEMNAPGRECAYVFHARKTFRGA